MNFIFKRCNLCKLYKNRCQKCQISQGGPPHPPDDQSGGWEAQGGPSHPPDFDRGVAPPPWTPLETASATILITKLFATYKFNLLYSLGPIETWLNLMG